MFKEEVSERMERYRRFEEDALLIDDIYNYLSDERGIVLLDPVSNYRRDRFLSIIKEYPDLKATQILEGKNARIFLRKIKLRTGKAQHDYMKVADKAYADGDYELAITMNKELVEKFMSVSAHTYEMLGLSYLNLGDIKEATDYLIVSSYTSSLEDEMHPKDYSEVINKLLNNSYKVSYIKDNSRNEKDYFHGKEYVKKERNEDMDLLKSVKEYAIENRVTFEEACNHFNLPNETRDMLKLLFAKEYYTAANMKQGDIYLNAVENTRGKTHRTEEMISEIREKKKFYQYATERNGKPVEKVKTLTYIKPGKRY